MTIPRSIALGLLASILIMTVYLSLLTCPTGVKVEGDLFTVSHCVTVTDGVVVSERLGL